MRLQTLANFRRYEDANVRRDENDGRLRYQPAGGLPINFEGRPPEVWADWRFTSSVREEDIYAYCMSTERSEALTDRFESPFCVEITDPVVFVRRIHRAVRLRSRLERKCVHHGPVDYRDVEAVPAADWALPEKVGRIKPPDWAWQREYRVLVGKKGAFDPENVRLTLERGPQPAPPAGAVPDPPLSVRLGNCSNGMRLHRF